jgi:hypothetical protein
VTFLSWSDKSTFEPPQRRGDNITKLEKEYVSVINIEYIRNFCSWTDYSFVTNFLVSKRRECSTEFQKYISPCQIVWTKNKFGKWTQKPLKAISLKDFFGDEVNCFSLIHWYWILVHPVVIFISTPICLESGKFIDLGILVSKYLYSCPYSRVLNVLSILKTKVSTAT